jgi:GNAT superfamily N-acetyltransferase
MATLRRVRPRDGGVLSDLRLRALAGDPLAFGSTLEREAPWDDEWDDWARRHADGGDEATFIAIADDGAPAGIAGGFRNQDHPGRFELFAMWISPEHRRQGHATRLIEGVAGWAREHGGRELCLWVTDPRARGVYELSGFHDDGRREPLEHTPTVTMVGMTRPLA